MIKLRNIAQTVISIRVQGTMSATLPGIAGVIVPFTGFITNIAAAVCAKASGTTASRIDINKNGTTIFSATTTQITFAATTGVPTYGALTQDPIQVTAGDLLTLDLDTVGVSHGGCIVDFLLDKTNPKLVSTLGTTASGGSVEDIP